MSRANFGSQLNVIPFMCTSYVVIQSIYNCIRCLGRDFVIIIIGEDLGVKGGGINRHISNRPELIILFKTHLILAIFCGPIEYVPI